MTKFNGLHGVFDQPAKNHRLRLRNYVPQTSKAKLPNAQKPSFLQAIILKPENCRFLRPCHEFPP